MSNDVPLTPAGGGGMCIAPAALQPADIIVSAGTGTVSAVIRAGTGSEVSHAALYVGGETVVEAVGEGVVRRSLGASLSEHYLAVAYRVAGITPRQAQAVVNAAAGFRGAYDTAGAAGAGLANRPVVCVLVFGIVPCATASMGGFKSSDKFYCSQLVLEAFRRAGASFITDNPNTSTPQTIVNAYSRSRLMYVGHLLSGEEYVQTA